MSKDKIKNLVAIEAYRVGHIIGSSLMIVSNAVGLVTAPFGSEETKLKGFFKGLNGAIRGIKEDAEEV